MTIKPSGEVIIIREFALVFFRRVELLNLSFIVLNIHVKNSKHLNKNKALISTKTMQKILKRLKISPREDNKIF